MWPDCNRNNEVDVTHNVFTKDDIETMKSYNITWQPSKLRLACRTASSSDKKIRRIIKVEINKKKRKKYGAEKFKSYVMRRAARAMEEAIDYQIVEDGDYINGAESEVSCGNKSRCSSEQSKRR